MTKSGLGPGDEGYVAVSFDASGAEPVSATRLCLTDNYDFGGGASIANYDVTFGGRLIMIRRGVNGGKLRLVANLTEELTRILAAEGVN